MISGSLRDSFATCAVQCVGKKARVEGRTQVWCKIEVCSDAHLVVAEIYGRRFARHLDRIRVPASLATFLNKPNDTAAAQP